MDIYEKTIEVRWSDCDSNQHVRHSAYYDYGAHVRIRFFSEMGYDAQQMNELQLGPILFKEECSFIREIRLDDVLRVRLSRGAVNADASRWVLHHEIFNQHDQKCAHITIKGAWMDLAQRKLTVPPQDLAQQIHALAQGEAYVYKKG